QPGYGVEHARLVGGARAAAGQHQAGDGRGGGGCRGGGGVAVAVGGGRIRIRIHGAACLLVESCRARRQRGALRSRLASAAPCSSSMPLSRAKAAAPSLALPCSTT